MKYYVYILFNPLIVGEFKSSDYKFEYEPFYVGKGKGDRINETIYEKRNSFKKNIINKIYDNNLTPIKIIIKDNLNEEMAFLLEKELIQLIGRRNLKLGTLTNLTDGGEGTSGIKQSQKTIEKRKKSLFPYRQHFKSDEFSEKMKIVAKKRTDRLKKSGYYENLSIKYKGSGNPMFGKHTSEKQKNAIKKAHIEGKINISERGRKNIIEASHNRKGKKNKNKKCDSKKYEILSPNNEKFIIFGAVDLQKFCKDNKLQFHVIKNNKGLITSEMVVGNKIFAKNTIGWKIL